MESGSTNHLIKWASDYKNYLKIQVYQYFSPRLLQNDVPSFYIPIATFNPKYIIDTTSIETGAVSSTERCCDVIVIDWYPQHSENLEKTWWCHQMGTFSVLLDLCAGNSPVTGDFPSQMPVTRSFDVFFDVRLNKRLSKQSRRWWFETPSRSLWRHCN